MRSKARVQFRITHTEFGWPRYQLQFRHSLWGFTVYWETIRESDHLWDLQEEAERLSTPWVDYQVQR
jgi:hypothetical protein